MSLAKTNTTAIEEEISNIVIELYENIASLADNTDLNDVHDFIENYNKKVTRIGFRLAKSDFAVLRDSCVIFHDILNNLYHKNSLLSDNQLQQFEVWPTLILSYISEPNNEDNINLILDFLVDPVWEYETNHEEIKQLKTAFYDVLTPSQTSHTKEGDLSSDTIHAVTVSETSTVEADDDDIFGDGSQLGAFDGAVFESIQAEILEAMTSLISDLSSIDSDDDFGLNHAFNLCADRIELLGMSIATAGLMGLMDVCMIFQSGLRKLANREKQLTEDEQIIIEEWTSHLIAYLDSPTDNDIVDQLVDYLNNMPWSEPMSEDESLTLRLMLIPEVIELTAPDNENYEDEFSIDEPDQGYSSINKDNDVLDYELVNEEGLDELSISDNDKSYFPGQELVQLIHDEFQLEQSSLDEIIQKIPENTEFNQKNIENISQFNQMIERFLLATDSIGLSGLNKTLDHIVTNMRLICSSDVKIINSEVLNYLKNFSKISLDYLSDMDNTNIIENLVEPLYLSGWSEQIKIDKESLIKELLSPRLDIEDDIEIRATQATIDDISLKLPEDVNQTLLNTLLQELPVQTEQFTQSITQLVEGNASLKDIEKAQRIAHTLKGAANTVGITGIATLTHHIEDIFDVFTKNNRLPGKNLADILMNAADVLEMMSESLLGMGEPPEQAQSVLQQILDWANLIDQEGIPEDDAQIKLTDNLDDNATSDSDTSHLNEVAAPVMLRVPASLMDDLLRIAGESIILGGQLQERLRKASEQTKLVHEQNSLYQQLVFELEQIVDIQGLTANKPDNKSNEVFDSLELEQYNELHTVTHRLVEAATDSKELTHEIEDELHKLDTLLVDQSRLHKENQNIVMQTRMVPVQNIVPRLQRSIRQTSRSTNKNVSLNVTGTETLMDSDVLDELVDPIMHILRNAVDHGIETESTRKTKGKKPNGNINLSFFRDGDHIVVRCKDDGEGLNFDSIRKTAVKKNFIKESQKTSEEELIRLIWLPGFTTRDTTTQVSGRGIGMDAVYNQISAMKGTINISSEKDIGCTFELRLPLTLISVHAILIKLRKQTIAVSNRGITQILCPGDGKLNRKNDEYTYELNDETYTVYDIETLLHQPRDQRNTDREERSVLLVQDETGRRFAVTVEEIIANQDLIVKQLGSYIPDIIGIEGATILGNGSVAPVLDLPGLIRTVANKEINPLIEQRLAEAEPIKDNLVALVVDDSLSARRSLAEFVKDIGYDVRMARDGIEALDVIESKKPDIILVDLEMPRMNGLELTSHVRSKSSTKDIPIIMITSRSTEKHREMADAAGVNNYLTKPFSEDELLENIQNLLLAVN